MQGLAKTNAIAAVVHFVTALLIVFLYNHWPATHSRAYFKAYRMQVAGPLTLNICTTDGLQSGNYEDEAVNKPGQCTVDIAYQQPKDVVSVNLIYGVLAFFFFTAGAHLFYATDAFGLGHYSKALAQGWNPYRWFEYGVSASIMIVLIGLTIGVRDVGTLVALMTMNTSMQFTGYAVESALRQDTSQIVVRDTISIINSVGWTLFLGTWVILFYNFSTVVSDVGSKYKGLVQPNGQPIKVPSWVWFIILIQVFQFATFGFVSNKHMKAKFASDLGRGDSEYSYYGTEFAYIGLSYSAKLALAAGLGYGLLFRIKDCDA